MSKESFEQSVLEAGFEESQLSAVSALVLLVEEAQNPEVSAPGTPLVMTAESKEKARETVLRLLVQGRAEGKDLSDITNSIKREHEQGKSKWVNQERNLGTEWTNQKRN